jgi:hypothetical protein
MHAGIDTHSLMACSATSGPPTKIVLRSLHRPVCPADLSDYEFQFATQEREDRIIPEAFIDLFHRGKFMGDPAHGLHGTVQEEFEPPLVEAFRRL